jgi:nitrite reductase/ring-hydroxylating ferredoxin subunit
MPLVRIGSVDELPPGSVIEAFVGDQRFAICNVGGRIHALSGTCPHRGGPVGQGAIHEESVVCPWHAWEFNCASGEHDYNPEIVLPRYMVEVHGGDILIDVG